MLEAGKLSEGRPAAGAIDPFQASAISPSVSLFGSPVVIGIDGQMLISRRGRAIIGYLALSETPRATRERLIGLFWPDRSEIQARASLRQCLVDLRAAFGDAIIAGREWITLDDSRIGGDWPALKAALAGSDAVQLTAALAVIGAEPLLAGMEFGDAFDSWLRSSRALLDSRIAETAARLVDTASPASSDAGNGRCALSLADAWLVRNPYDEAVAASAIRIEMKRGPAVEAKRRYREFEAILLHEGHGQPGAAIRAALDQSALPAPVEERVARLATNAIVAGPQPTIAVLPFDNLSSDLEMTYFSDGVSEDILSRLIRGSRPRVIGRMSSFQFRDANKPMAAKALNATHILDGSIRRSGTKVRITAHLTEASGVTLWSDHFDRNLEDIFTIQDEISEAIAGKLHTDFFPEKSVRIDPEVYDLFLQARAIYSEDLKWADQERCIQLLTQAISLAPDFAGAWGRLAAYRRGAPAVAAAHRALKIKPDCAVALAALAMTQQSFSGHVEKLKLAERAYRLDPDDQLVAGSE